MLTDLAWCAGLFDGEGCICISLSTNGYRLSVRINMNHESALRRVQQIMGAGTLRAQCLRPPRHQTWTWFIGRRSEVERILATLLPYLVVKREEASIGLRFLRASSTAEQASLFWAMRNCKTKPGRRHREVAQMKQQTSADRVA